MMILQKEMREMFNFGIQCDGRWIVLDDEFAFRRRFPTQAEGVVIQIGSVKIIY